MLFALILFSLIFSLTFHEFGHGIMARWMGDVTAQQAGRLTLNPLAHIDPMGLLMVVLVGFGFAKPVPTNPANYRHRWGVFLVALAGPAMNLLLAIITINLYLLGQQSGLQLFQGQAAETFFVFIASINLILMLFNLIPIGPLDGHYLLAYLLPKSVARIYVYYNYRYGSWIMLGLILLAIIGLPVFDFVWELSQTLLNQIMWL